MTKKEKQIAKKNAHKERLKQSKARRRNGGDIDRNEPNKNERIRMLIVCEGKNTEPSYFQQFKLSFADIYPIGEGKNTISLIDSVEGIVARSEIDYDEIWCVFDKDDFPNQNFDNAIHKAESLGYNVAYSNQAFELWFIIHFEYHNGGAMHRDDYCGKLNNLLTSYNIKYDCDSKIVESDFFELMISLTGKDKEETLQDIAIQSAKRMCGNHLDNTPANSESSTTVYKLVERLNEFK